MQAIQQHSLYALSHYSATDFMLENFEPEIEDVREPRQTDEDELLF